ncbi:COR domain-containing protein [Methanosarcina sp. T3]|uniref:leucine-rich repeat domain-containing protein n=1 Tax=Methanosarcina sp. T3 TaxID=3439062 RepID=UPI003F845877
MEQSDIEHLIQEGQKKITQFDQVLDLSFKGLYSIPPSVLELKEITQLNISKNQLRSLPPEISELINLIQLDISENQLSFLPSKISELKNLTQLNISGNQLSSLPPEIFELKNLTQLNMAENLLSSFPTEVFELKNLSLLDISGNQLRSIPSKISELKNLTQLSISNNQLRSIPLEISELKNLTQLDIRWNQLSSLSSEIFKLKNLTQLNVCGNHLISLPPEIFELKNLSLLDISGNQLNSLPSEILGLKSLTVLNIAGNQLSSLPPEIFELKNLTQLNISGNQLSSLPPEIFELKNLTQLNISGNQLSSLPSEIFELKNLTLLDISSNQLNFLPSDIVKLDLPIKWEKFNNFWERSSSWEKNNLSGIYFEGNPIENLPLEIAKKGREAILYYLSLEGEKKPLNEVKVLLVGDGGAGKTSLVKKICGKNIDGDEPQTQGIKIKKWVINNGRSEINANFWDFGGQEIMHATHQFFLSRRSLYILVLDGRKNENSEYWLKLIENFSDNSPVLIVMNKIDENPAFDINRKFLMKKYPSIRGFYRLSCKSGEGIDEFLSTLNEELCKLNSPEIKWPKSWFNVKKRLECIHLNCQSNTDNKNNFKVRSFIEYKDYTNICDEEGITEESERNTLVDFLHDLGVILHFRDINLLNTYVLEPEWITNAVNKIVNSKEIAESRGILKLDMLPNILRQSKGSNFYYPLDQYVFIIGLMKKFELSYDLDDHTLLLPSLLEVQEPDYEFEYEGALKFLIDYDFLPLSVMPRFIVKMHEDIKDNLQWRTGVVLENKDFNSYSVVKVDHNEKLIYVYVNGVQKRDYLSSILFNIREINRSFKNLKAIEKICLPDEPEVSIEYNHLVSLERRGIQRVVPEGAQKEYYVKSLLGFGKANISNELEEEKILQILKKVFTKKTLKFSERLC